MRQLLAGGLARSGVHASGGSRTCWKYLKGPPESTSNSWTITIFFLRFQEGQTYLADQIHPGSDVGLELANIYLNYVERLHRREGRAGEERPGGGMQARALLDQQVAQLSEPLSGPVSWWRP